MPSRMTSVWAGGHRPLLALLPSCKIRAVFDECPGRAPPADLKQIIPPYNTRFAVPLLLQEDIKQMRQTAVDVRAHR